MRGRWSPRFWDPRGQRETAAHSWGAEPRQEAPTSDAQLLAGITQGFRA